MKILLPVDFSSVSINAIQYAYAMYPQAEFKIIHIASGVISTREPFYLKEGKTKKLVLAEELENEILNAVGIKELPNNFSHEVVDGETVPGIKAVAEDYKPDLIIMGTRDNYDLLDKVFGTISLRVTKNGLAHTLLVPRYAKFEKMNRVIVATDHHMQETGLLDWIVEWNRERLAYISFIHIQDRDKDDVESLSASIVHALLKQKKIDFEFKIENVRNLDVTETLLSKAYNEGADLVIAAPDQQSLLNSLLIKSVSKELIQKSKIPVMFLKH